MAFKWKRNAVSLNYHADEMNVSCGWEILIIRMISSYHADDNSSKVLIESTKKAKRNHLKAVCKLINTASEQTGWNCSPEAGELREAVRGMKTSIILLPLCPKASPLLQGRSPSGEPVSRNTKRKRKKEDVLASTSSCLFADGALCFRNHNTDRSANHCCSNGIQNRLHQRH